MELKVVPWLQRKLVRPFGFQSLYAPHQKENFPFTNTTPDFKGCIDYILFQPSKFKQISILALPRAAEDLRISSSEYLPSCMWPSDNLVV